MNISPIQYYTGQALNALICQIGSKFHQPSSVLEYVEKEMDKIVILANKIGERLAKI